MTAIMISLVAVVLLILVIGFFAMRYLRADDADEFEDMPAERGRPRGAGQGSAGQGSTGQVGAGQEWGGGGRVVPMPARSQGRAPRPAAPGHPGSFERARERGQSRGGRDYPQGRRPAPTPARAAAEPDFAGADFRGNRSQPSRRPDDRRPDDRRPDDRPARRPAAASARSGRGKSDDMSGKDWDSLSDVDYWAELASDKPLTTTAQPASPAARSERPQPDRREADQPDPRKARPAAAASGRVDGPGRTEESTALLPVRRRPAAGARPENIPGRYPESRPRREQPASPDHGVAALARLGNGNGGRPAPADDDPLTSPSFPAIRADDSRSYRRTGRPHAAEPEYQAPGGYPAPQYPAGGGTGQNGYGQAAGYAPAQPPVPAGNPYGSYVTPVPARHGDDAAYGYLPPSQETQQYSQASQVHAAPVYDRGGQYAAPSHPHGPGQPGGYPVSAGGQYQQPAGADAGQGQYPEPGYGAEPYGSYPGY
ncbi:MAG TPA: hypothetical protein VGG25_15320 [Streptosporangiaceae bacterium]|jgi:hypothetical protein